MQVRKARADELDAVRAIVDEAYSPWVERIGLRPAPMDDDYAVKIRDGLVDVVVDDNELLGLVVLVPDDDALLVENVAVRPAAQGLGVGRNCSPMLAEPRPASVWSSSGCTPTAA